MLFPGVREKTVAIDIVSECPRLLGTDLVETRAFGNGIGCSGARTGRPFVVSQISEWF